MYAQMLHLKTINALSIIIEMYLEDLGPESQWAEAQSNYRTKLQNCMDT